MLRKVRKKNELSGACLLLLARLFMSKIGHRRPIFGHRLFLNDFINFLMLVI